MHGVSSHLVENVASSAKVYEKIITKNIERKRLAILSYEKRLQIKDTFSDRLVTQIRTAVTFVEFHCDI